MSKTSYIQIRTTDGQTLYSGWGNDKNGAHRLRDFANHVTSLQTIKARKTFIRSAPEYEVMLNIEQIVSLSLISEEWEEVLDEGQVPFYLYEDEIRALINATLSVSGYGTDYEPPALTTARLSLEESLDEPERLH